MAKSKIAKNGQLYPRPQRVKTHWRSLACQASLLTADPMMEVTNPPAQESVESLKGNAIPSIPHCWLQSRRPGGEAGSRSPNLPAGADLHNVCKRAAAKLGIAWLETPTEVTVSCYEGRRLPKVKSSTKQFLPFFPECMEEATRLWSNPLSAKNLVQGGSVTWKRKISPTFLQSNLCSHPTSIPCKTPPWWQRGPLSYQRLNVFNLHWMKRDIKRWHCRWGPWMHHHCLPTRLNSRTTCQSYPHQPCGMKSAWSRTSVCVYTGAQSKSPKEPWPWWSLKKELGGWTSAVSLRRRKLSSLKSPWTREAYSAWRLLPCRDDVRKRKRRVKHFNCVSPGRCCHLLPLQHLGRQLPKLWLS